MTERAHPRLPKPSEETIRLAKELYKRNVRKRKPPRMSAEETGRLGREIYERDIKARVEPECNGKFVAIDVESGAWAMGEDMMEAENLLDALRPEAVDIKFERVGYRYVFKFGGGHWRPE